MLRLTQPGIDLACLALLGRLRRAATDVLAEAPEFLFAVLAAAGIDPVNPQRVL
ncbi:MAG TPA: hypothetical protein VF982_11880 [Anaerolineales bacterium]